MLRRSADSQSQAAPELYPGGLEERRWSEPGRPASRAQFAQPATYECSDFSGSSFNLSAIRQSSGSDVALIFRIKLLRCTFTVVSVMPKSPAICLFSRPATT